MGPTRWQKSTQVFVGLAVLAFVAAVVAAATFFTIGGARRQQRARPDTASARADGQAGHGPGQ